MKVSIYSKEGCQDHIAASIVLNVTIFF